MKHLTIFLLFVAFMQIGATNSLLFAQGDPMGSGLHSFLSAHHSPSQSLSDSVQQTWVARYNGPGNGTDITHAMTVDGSGNVYVTGESWGGTPNEYDYATTKYNASGVQHIVGKTLQRSRKWR